MPDDRTPRRRALDRVLVRVLSGREHHSPAAVMVDAADALEADGWRPPARIITTDEECAALPIGTIVLDKFGAGCTRVHRDPLIGWVRASSALRSRMGHQQHAPWLPATVLHMPEEGRDA